MQFRHFLDELLRREEDNSLAGIGFLPIPQQIMLRQHLVREGHDIKKCNWILPRTLCRSVATGHAGALVDAVVLPTLTTIRNPRSATLETSKSATVDTSTLVFAPTTSAGPTDTFHRRRLDGELHIECRKVQQRHFLIEPFGKRRRK